MARQLAPDIVVRVVVSCQLSMNLVPNYAQSSANLMWLVLKREIKCEPGTFLILVLFVE